MRTTPHVNAGGLPPASGRTAEPDAPGPLGVRLKKFAVLLGLTLLFVYGLLPALTGSVPVLDRMAHHIEENGIDPTRYFYTDVAQVREAELYLDEALRTSADNR